MNRKSYTLESAKYSALQLAKELSNLNQLLDIRFTLSDSSDDQTVRDLFEFLARENLYAEYFIGVK